jgi:hypothetical protein
MADKNLAKQIIVEIVRIAGGRLESMTRLFKAFYFAHLFYAQGQSGYLSDWPIVHMRRGPGIKDADLLLAELCEEERISIQLVPDGPFQRKEYRTTPKDMSPEPLSEGAIIAIRQAVDLVKKSTVSDLTELTHEHSRSWRHTREGDELNIYLDLIPDDDYHQRKEDLEALSAVMDEFISEGRCLDTSARPID